jgi:hypothetical protein
MAVNLWPNADLESGVDDWNLWTLGTLEQSSTRAWEQTYSLKYTADGYYRGVISDVVGVDASTQYTISAYVYIEGTLAFRAAVYDQDDNELAYWTPAYTENSWSRISATFTTGAGDTGIKFGIKKHDSGDANVFYVDGIMLETGDSASEWANYEAPAVGPTYVDNGGVGESLGGSVDVPYPATVDENDILILQLLSSEAANHNAIDGWTKVTEVDQGTNSTVSWYWKRAAGTESGSVTATKGTASGSFYGLISRWSGCITSGTPYEESSSTSGSSAAASSSSITPTGNGRRIVCLIAAEGDITVGTLAGGNYAEDFEITDS